MGVSIDSRFSHDNWAKSCGGVCFTRVQDFNTKRVVGTKKRGYMGDKGVKDRAAGLIAKQGIVRYAASVTPAGERNPKDLLAEAQKVNKG